MSKRVISQIKNDLSILSQKGTVPRIAIITLGPDTTWKAYVRQKSKLAEKLGITAEIIKLTNENQETLLKIIKELNNNQKVHGIIVQRPFSKELNKEEIINTIIPEKDIDGFRKDSKFKAPIWQAIESILKETFRLSKRSDLVQDPILTKTNYLDWLKSKSILVIGKGETGGKPIIEELEKLGIRPIVIDSQTKNKLYLLKKADIIISAVGKERVVQAKNLKKGVILIGIGIHRGKEEKIKGDYNEEEIENIASYYTPTPGGIGPLNLSYLFLNLLKAALKQTKN